MQKVGEFTKLELRASLAITKTAPAKLHLLGPLIPNKVYTNVDHAP